MSPKRKEMTLHQTDMALHLHSIAALLVLALVALSHGDDQEGAEQAISIEILSPPPENCERKSKRNDMLFVHYVGTLTESGRKFDSSLDRGDPFEFQLGAGQVIKGWEEGLTDMCVGEKRKLIIPASKGYGSKGAGESIPPNAGLTYEVELIDIKDGQAPRNVFKEIDSNEDKFLSQEELQKQTTLNNTIVRGVKLLEEKLRRKASELMEQRNEIITDIFKEEDQDKDGFISHDEFSGPKHDEL
ncbi:hypothetical protein EGW08_021385 [Elysia chlorotica]|uniref:peptidylprolyl isomerase n=1 Tax=Elysia chlorotica TaxID=188477 RepID=A0A3S1ASH5_ELYCH|nr:hypothetical protein EGW08_021385 [Elysia chlorotica]